MKQSGAYLIKDKSNGKFYAGSSEDIDKRLGRHISDLKQNVHKNKNLQKEYNNKENVGFFNNFRFIEIHTESKEKAIEVEQLILDIHKNDNILYNIATDAKHSGTGRVISPEGLESLRAFNTGKKRSLEQIEKMRQANLGKVQSQETKDKRRDSMYGKNLGKKHTEEYKSRMSLIKSGTVLTEEHKTKISLGLTGQKRSDEAKENMRKAALSYRAVPILVDGIEYPSIRDAAIANNLSDSSAKDRANSNTGRFDNWKWKNR